MLFKRGRLGRFPRAQCHLTSWAGSGDLVLEEEPVARDVGARQDATEADVFLLTSFANLGILYARCPAPPFHRQRSIKGVTCHHEFPIHFCNMTGDTKP